jgi:hypothetical protein
MSFFDDKQEILKVELTIYGRFLLSRGKFKPAYYAFFDDDIIYDGAYAGVDETQKSIQGRILDETLSLKPQTTFTSLEKTVKMSTLLPSEEGKLKQEEAQVISDKNYALSLPLAKSAINSDYAPSWNITVINGQISNVDQYIDNSDGNLDVVQPFIKYPQINLKNSVYDIRKNINDFSTLQDYNVISVYNSGSDSYYYSMNDQPIIVDLKESNVDDLNENFDIEIFEIQESGSTETLNQLKFKKKSISILNGILLDEPITFQLEDDPTLVDYYFEATIDNEIQLPPQQKLLLSRMSGSANGSAKAPFGVDC